MMPEQVIESLLDDGKNEKPSSICLMQKARIILTTD